MRNRESISPNGVRNSTAGVQGFGMRRGFGPIRHEIPANLLRKEYQNEALVAAGLKRQMWIAED